MAARKKTAPPRKYVRKVRTVRANVAALKSMGWSAAGIEGIKKMMRESNRLMTAMAYEDDAGIILRVAILVERSLQEAIVRAFPVANKTINWDRTMFDQKMRFAQTIGQLPAELVKPVSILKKMRNAIAHTDAEIDAKTVSELVNAMPKGDAAIIRARAKEPAPRLRAAAERGVPLRGLLLRAALLLLEARMRAVAGGLYDYYKGEKSSYVLNGMLNVPST